MPGLEEVTLGHHRLKYLLGQGGMSEVYLGFDEQLHREVAIKVVHQSKEENFLRFQLEAETSGPLTHEHILPIFEYGEQGPWHYLVMPYMSKGTLDEYLQGKGSLTPEEAGNFLEQIASALQFAHERGILHRDIKPSNILLRDASYAYLADFGIAKAQERESHLTHTGFLMGTPAYMAPELAEEPAGPGSDIYSLGVILYQMLTGQLPFQEGATPLGTFLKHVQEAPMAPSLLNSAISPALDQVVLRALAKDPRQRFQTPQALVNAYKQALQGVLPQYSILSSTPPIWSNARTEQIPSPFQTAPARASRKPSLIIAAVGGLLLFLAILGSVALMFTHLNAGSDHSNQAAAGKVHATSSLPSPTPTPTRLPSPTPTATPDTCSGQVSLQDTAQILERGPVCTAAKTLPYGVTIYTTRTFTQGDGDFEHMAQTLVTDPQMIVIAIKVDPTQPGAGPAPAPHVHIVIVGGTSVQLSDDQYHRAMDTFNHMVTNGDYTSATIDAIQVLRNQNQG